MIFFIKEKQHNAFDELERKYLSWMVVASVLNEARTDSS